VRTQAGPGYEVRCVDCVVVLYCLPTSTICFHTEFVFHKPYARDESESREFCEALQQHARLAHTRQCCYLLPLVESQHSAAVKLAVSSLLHISLCVFHRCLRHCFVIAELD
jgi:hypothetical protein